MLRLGQHIDSRNGKQVCVVQGVKTSIKTYDNVNSVHVD